jgi:hypothetical protein
LGAFGDVLRELLRDRDITVRGLVDALERIDTGGIPEQLLWGYVKAFA